MNGTIEMTIFFRNEIFVKLVETLQKFFLQHPIYAPVISIVPQSDLGRQPRVITILFKEAFYYFRVNKIIITSKINFKKKDFSYIT